MKKEAAFEFHRAGTVHQRDVFTNPGYSGLTAELDKGSVLIPHEVKKRLLLKRLQMLSLVVQQEEDISLLFSRYAGELTGMVAAEGVSINYMGQMKTYGNVPFPEDIEEIIFWLDEQRFDDLYYTNSLSKHASQATSLEKSVIGIMAIKLSEGQYLIWYRPGSPLPTPWQHHEIELIKIFEDYLSGVLIKSRP